jgi:hypothetical protein
VVIVVGVALALLLGLVAIGTPTRRLEARRQKAAELRREGEEQLASAGRREAMHAGKRRDRAANASPASRQSNEQTRSTPICPIRAAETLTGRPPDNSASVRQAGA